MHLKRTYFCAFCKTILLITRIIHIIYSIFKPLNSKLFLHMAIWLRIWVHKFIDFALILYIVHGKILVFNIFVILYYLVDAVYKNCFETSIKWVIWIQIIGEVGKNEKIFLNNYSIYYLHINYQLYHFAILILLIYLLKNT